MGYGMTVRVEAAFADAVERTRSALQDQGFGVLTEIDVQATLQEKLGEQVEPYLILGACNPPLAHRALEADRQVGLLLPCNVVVRADGEGALVEALDPHVMSRVAGHDRLDAVADEARERLQAALETLRA